MSRSVRAYNRTTLWVLACLEPWVPGTGKYPAGDDGVAHPADLAGDGRIVLLGQTGLVDDGAVDEGEGAPPAGGVDQLHAALVPDLSVVRFRHGGLVFEARDNTKGKQRIAGWQSS